MYFFTFADELDRNVYVFVKNNHIRGLTVKIILFYVYVYTMYMRVETRLAVVYYNLVKVTGTAVCG